MLFDSFITLSAALLEHVLALFSLAAVEIKELFAKTLSCLFLFVAVLFFLLIGYLALLATLMAIAILEYGFAWPMVLGSAALFHFGVAALLLLLLRNKYSYSPFAMTRFEIQRDVEALTHKNFSNENGF